jgi:hypothetical protein
MASFTQTSWLGRIAVSMMVVPVGVFVGSTVIASPPAGAQAPPLVPGAPMQLAPPGSRAEPATTVESGNWSGYAVKGSTYTHVATTVVVPKLTCTSTDASAATWVGLDGYSNKTVEQTGIATQCQGGAPAYSAWYETYPNPPVYYSNPVVPGDVMKESVTATTGDSFTLALSDVTQGWSRTTTQRVAAAKRASAEVIVEAPSEGGVPVPLADFGTVPLTKAKVDGTPIGNLNPVTIIMVSGSTQEDAVSALTKDKNFTVTWLNSGGS